MAEEMPMSHFTLRIPQELHDRLRLLAALKKQSLNGAIVALLDEGASQKRIDDLYKQAKK